MLELKKLRVDKKLTQKQASEIVGVSLRTYKSYENDIAKSNTQKYNFIKEALADYVVLDENHGVLSVEDIKKSCAIVFTRFKVKYCFLFGSYAKGNHDERSNVELLISTQNLGVQFYSMCDCLHKVLNKRVEVIDVRQLLNNPNLLDEILSDGIKIFDNRKLRDSKVSLIM